MANLIELVAIVVSVISIIATIWHSCYSHFHDKLKNPEGRSELIQHLCASGLTSRYVDLLRSGLRVVFRFSGNPFSLRSLGVSLTLAGGYQYAAAVIGRYRGSPSKLGDVNLFQIGHYRSISFDSEIGLVSAIFIVTILAIIGPRVLRKSMKSDLNFSRSLSPANRLKSREFASAFFVGMAVGGLIGAFSGFFAVVLPLMLVASLLTSMTRWEALVSMVVLVNAVISTLSGIEANTVEVLSPISTGGIIAAAISMYVLMLHPNTMTRRNLLCVMGSFSIFMAMIYLTYRLITEGSLAESMVIVLVFWIALPIANGINDYLSLGITHVLLRRIVQSRNLTPSRAVLYGVLDLVLAIIFVGVVAVCIVVGLGLSQQFSPFDLDLRTFVLESASDPLGYGIWVGIMMLTTLVWTGFHFLIILVALGVHLYDGNPLDRHAVKSLTSGEDRLWVKYYLSTKWMITLALWVIIVGLIAVIFAKVCSYLGILGFPGQLALVVVDLLVSIF